jgi:hypothetical protein
VKKTLLSIFLSLTSTVYAEAYLCVGDQSTGFSFNQSTKEWSHARFNTKEAKYILSNGSGKWEWKKIGEKNGIECDSSFSEYGYMNCESLRKITFNKKTLRYMSIYSIGYVNIGVYGKEGEDNPSIEIGKCSSM